MFAKDGFLFAKDAEAGQRVDEMETNSIPFASARGLEFYKINVLDDPVCAMMPLACDLKIDSILAQATYTRFNL